MKFGETFVIAGLLSMRKTAEAAKIPFIGELPWIGAAFRRVRYDEAETELVIMVTPELVAPMSCDQVPCGGPGMTSTTPTDRELYIDGFLEVPFYGDECINCAPQGTLGPGACGPNGCGPTGVPLPDGSFAPGPVPLGPLPVTPGMEMQDSVPVPPGPAAAPYENPPPPAPPASAETSLWGPAAPALAEPTTTRFSPSEAGNPFAPRGADAFQPSQVDATAPTRDAGRTSSVGRSLGTDETVGRTSSFGTGPTRPGLIEPRPGLIEPETGWQPTRAGHGLIAPSMR
jgi:pilus assembly protein CpaC